MMVCSIIDGSVATTEFSSLEYLDIEKMYLFVQNLGFVGTYAHAMDSTSNVKIIFF